MAGSLDIFHLNLFLFENIRYNVEFEDTIYIESVNYFDSVFFVLSKKCSLCKSCSTSPNSLLIINAMFMLFVSFYILGTQRLSLKILQKQKPIFISPKISNIQFQYSISIPNWALVSGILVEIRTLRISTFNLVPLFWYFLMEVFIKTTASDWPKFKSGTWSFLTTTTYYS